MFEQIGNMVSSISVTNLNVLLLLGLALFGGTAGGRLFQKLRIPQVVGYMIIGVLIGQAGLNIINPDIVEALKPFNYFALGLIGFMVGGELRKEIFAKYGKQFIYILLSEGFVPFLLVSVFLGIIGSCLFDNPAFGWALALLLGAIASATDPATTTNVFNEYKTRGPLTTTVIGIVAMDDGLALLFFAIAMTTAEALIGHKSLGLINTIIHPFYEIGGAIGVGIISGLALRQVLTRYAEKERILAFSIGTVLLVTGISLAMNISMLLALMTLGVVLANTAPQKSKEAFSLVEGFTPPIYVLFFVLAGAKLHFNYMTMPIIFLVISYLFFGLTGKILGAYIGARLSNATNSILKYLPFSLFSQAGIAIGLSILVAQHFPGNLGNTLVAIVTTTTFITQMIGPPFTKYAVMKAGEIGLNITEEDIIKESKVSDMMDKNPPFIFESMQLGDILKIFSENDNLYYPVISKEKKLKGIITVEGIKQTFMDMDVSDLILAHDLMEPVVAKIYPDAPMLGVKEALNRYNIEYLPVVDREDIVEGFIERKMFNKFVSTKIIELQKKADSLG